jgi:hypothetical protein
VGLVGRVAVGVGLDADDRPAGHLRLGESRHLAQRVTGQRALVAPLAAPRLPPLGPRSGRSRGTAGRLSPTSHSSSTRSPHSRSRRSRR